MESKWYEEFFYGLAVDLWRQAISEDQTREEADFIADVLNVPSGGRILDIPSGLGRHTIELSRRGYRMTGVDLSLESITEARANAENAGLAIRWIHGDMTVIDRTCGQEPFEGAFCFGNSFGYADYETTTAFLRALNRCLIPGARFVLDTGFAAESLMPNFPGRRWYKIGDMYMLSEVEYNGDVSAIRTQYTFIRNGVVQTGTASYFLYTVAELKRLFGICGFEVQGLYASLKRDPYRFGSPRLLVVSTKAAA